MSKSRKKWLKKNKHLHNWRFNFESFPEKKTREWLETLNKNIVAEYMPDDFDRNFKLDFALPEEKLAIEINGNQHYKRDGTYQPYHVERQNYIESKGWKILNVPAINVLKKFDDVKLRILRFLQCKETQNIKPIKTKRNFEFEIK